MPWFFCSSFSFFWKTTPKYSFLLTEIIWVKDTYFVLRNSYFGVNLDFVYLFFLIQNNQMPLFLVGTNRIIISMNQGVVGHVARSGEIYITQEISKDPNFSKSTDKKTGYQTRRLLCFPITSSKGDIVAVGQLCNKIKGNCFSEFDRRLALRFVDLCAATLQHVSTDKKN